MDANPLPSTPSSRLRIMAIVAVLVGVIYVYPLLLDIPLLDPDEGLHATIAQEMVERGDLVTPRLLGQAFLDKPILFFWAQAESLKLLGMNEAGVRLPGLLFGLLGNLTTALLGWRLLGRTAGVLAGVFHLTLILPLALSQSPVHDAALVPWTNLALLAFWEATRDKPFGGALLHYLLAGLWLGFAILAKGLVGVALVGVAFGLYLLLARRIGMRTCLGLLLAILVGAAVAAPWYLMMESQNPGYAYYYFVKRHLFGFTTNTQKHGKAPFWYYLPILLAGGFPWIAFLPVAIRNLWQKRRDPEARLDSPRTLCWALLLGGLVFLSLAKSKLATYLLPIFPAVAILSADVWAQLQLGALALSCRRTLSRIVWLSCPAMCLALPAALAIIQMKLDVGFAAATWAFCLAVSAAFLLPLWFWYQERIRPTLTALLLGLACVFLFVMTALVPRLATANSARDLAGFLNRQGRVPAHVLLLEERVGSLIFYLDPELRAGLHTDQLRNVTAKKFSEMLPLSEDVLVVLPEKRVAHAAQFFNLSELSFQRIGHYRIYSATDLLAKQTSQR